MKERFVLLLTMMHATQNSRVPLNKRRYRVVQQRLACRAHRWLVQLQLIKHSVVLLLWKQQAKKANPECQIIGINLVEHLGDIVASEPVIRFLKRQNPNVLLVWFAREHYRELLVSHPDIDLVVPVLCITEGLLIRKLPIFDSFVDLHINGKECLCCRRKLVNSGNPEITINTFLSYGGLLQIFCECAGLPRLNDHPRIHIPNSCVLRVNNLNLPKKFVVIHCTANDECRNWATGRWQVLVRQLTEQVGLYVVEVGLNPVVLDDIPNYRNVCGQVSVMEMAEIINRADVFLGVESGPAHIANAVETPGVILLGPLYSFSRYLPYTGMYSDSLRTQHVYNEHGIKHITVEEVYNSLMHQLNVLHKGNAKSH